jgi:ATP synthase protein I
MGLATGTLRMANSALQTKVQNEAYRIVLYQLAGVVVLALIMTIIGGMNVGYAAFAGGMAYGLPNLFFVWAVFRFVRVDQMTQFVFAFFVGEMLKLLASAFLFILIVKNLPVSLLSTLAGFIGAIIAFWIVCMWHFSQPKGEAKAKV